MKIINIGGNDYKFEFTIEASLYNECTEKVSNLMFSADDAQNRNDAKGIISTLSDIPGTTLTMFYAGLLENHGADGDGTILSLKDAKKLIKVYFDEHKEDGTGNFYGVMQLMIECMEEDDFFSQIGLTQMTNQFEKEKKKPQDHKGKATKKVTEK